MMHTMVDYVGALKLYYQETPWPSAPIEGPARGMNPGCPWLGAVCLFHGAARGLLFISLLALGPSAALAQGALTNGWAHTGTISPIGDSDTWTFAANTGDRIILRVGEITQTGSFTPRLRLQNPSAVQIATASGAVAAEIAVTATNTGTYTVIVDDAIGTSATGTYRLTLAQSPGAVFVAPGDDGGPMPNGVLHAGTILTGDLDLWTFTANSGDNLVVRMGEITDTNTFYPWVRLYSPTGVLLDSSYNTSAAEVAVRATNSGTFMVVVGDGNGGFSGSGAYRLTLAKTGDPVVVSPGDNGGPMTNGVMHTGTILLGDLDLWTFTATSGDNLVVRMGEITDTNTFYPWVRLYGPNGVLLDSSYNALAAEVAVRATNSGTFLVVVGDGNGGLYGSGDYRLTLAKTGDPVVVSPGDDGGPMTNGVMQTGTILLGDLDLWTFTASTGDNLVVRMGQITDTNTFYTWVRLYGPDGALLRSSANSAAAEVTFRATNSGTFLVIVGDGNGGLYGSGDYRLTLAKTGSSQEVAPGDEGGPLQAGVNPVGVISDGDLDVYSFTTCKGESIHLTLDELVDNGSFFPWLRLYGPDGALLQSVSGATTAQINLVATNGGTFMVIVSDGNGALSGTGTYRLTSNGLANALRFCIPTVSGAGVKLAGIGGVPSATYILFGQTNATVHAAFWTPLRTNQFDSLGLFQYTNVPGPNTPQYYYRLIEEQ
jgi:trimeric autotransporter adhesin